MRIVFNFLFLYLGFGCLGLLSCKNAAKQAASGNTTETYQEAAMPSRNIDRNTGVPLPKNSQPAQIAPGHSRLVGEIISVNPELDKDKLSPCGKVPCQAMVKIKRILGYGTAFGAPLQEGQEIPVYFASTLSATPQFFPELANHLPGLKVGSSFQADVKATGEARKNYVVTSYQLLK